MLYQDKIFEGLSVEMIVHDGEYKGRYRTKVEEVGERILSVGVPVLEGQFIPLREGTEIQVIFSDQTSAYSFTSKIIRRIAVPIPTFIIEYPNRINKVQRRKFVRVPYVTTIKYQIIERNGFSEVKNGFMINLSGGGMLFKSNTPILLKSIIIIKVKLGDSEMEIPAMVIRCTLEEEKDTYMISAQFHEISEKVRDKIINYVFEIQREMRKKGLV